jgi:RNA polymerase-binding protein DksA
VSPAKAPAKAAKTSKSPAKTPTKAATKGAPARAGKAPGGASSVAKAPAKAAKSTTATGAKAAAAKKAAATKKAAPAEAAVRETARKTAAKAAPAKAAADQTSAAMVPAPDGRQEAGRVPTPSKASVSTPPKPPAKATGGRAAVLPGESPWTKGELAEIRGELETQAVDLRGEITDAESAWAALQRDSGEGAGDDQADAGTKTFEREHELSIAANSRDLLSQVERALQRIDDSTYGVCESCGKPIGKGRLQAFPRATLCMECKQREERR